MRNLIVCVAAWLCSSTTLLAQVTFTADDIVPPYNGLFYYGTNGGWYPTWDDMSIADIAAGNPSKNVKGVGSKTFRPPLPGSFVDFYGYNVRTVEFAHYRSLGVRDYTVILNSPVDREMDPAFYRNDGTASTSNECGEHSILFKNMYSPIWDGGLNGTPYNDTNYCAKYVYEIVSRYKDFTKFWEIVNEPDFDWTNTAWLTRGQPGNWWENAPKPCALNNLKAPVFHYIRWLRIAYDIIKTLDPTAYVAPGGLGYISFADVLCRYTDNPVDGSVTAQYPKPGSAYFDVLSFHSYPQYALAYWSNAAGGFVHERHSDRAAEKFVGLKNDFDSILHLYGYDGVQKPKKLFICTETNIASKSFSDMIGSDEAQTNYVMKALVMSQKHDILQTYFFVLGDSKTPATATSEFDLMGLYEELPGKGPVNGGTGYNQRYKNAGTAFKTMSDLLLGSRYDAAQTARLNLPATIEGGAFLDGRGQHIYVLWAKTTTDLVETATATYSFPAAMNMPPQLSLRSWHWGSTNVTTVVNSTNIQISSTPVLIAEEFSVLPVTDKPTVPKPDEHFSVNIYPNPASANASITFTLKNSAKVKVAIFNSEGRQVATAIADRSFTGGTHVVSLPVQKLVSGVYYCRFSTEKSEEMKKFIIAR
ncbi:MAG: T9SS type A sorting domain-containing protein [Niastella sp.]|nr:T9SS type A sorting domain-containing protein [Niastella sp.]